MKPSPAPWEADCHDSKSAETTYWSVQDADGSVIFDTSNSEAMCIEADHDEDGSHYWDEQGRVNLKLAAAAPDMIEALRRIETEAVSLGAEKCPAAPHACPKCEILYVARDAIAKATK